MALDAIIVQLRERLATVQRSLIDFERLVASSEAPKPGSSSIRMPERIAAKACVINKRCKKHNDDRRNPGPSKKLRS